MKRIKTAAIITLALIALSGCKPTPESKAVRQKDTTQMLAQAEQGDEGSAQLLDYKVPERYTAQLSSKNNDIVVAVDAEIKLPGVESIPTARVTRKGFDQQTVDMVREYFLGDSPMYKHEETTRQQAEENLLWLYSIRAGKLPLSELDGGTKTMEDLEGIIAEWEALLQTAPDEGEVSPMDTNMVKTDWSEAELDGRAFIDGQQVNFSAANRWAGYNDFIFFSKHNYSFHRFSPMDEVLGYTNLPNTKVIDPIISEDEARQMGDKCIKALGLEGFVLDNMYLINLNEEPIALAENGRVEAEVELRGAYQLEYVRTVGGVPLTYTGIEASSLEDEDAMDKIWQYESVSITVNDGIEEFNWSSPYTQPEIITASAQLMPFDEITDIFEKMILVKNAWVTSSNAESDDKLQLKYEIAEVKLGLMRVKERNSSEFGVLVPVWDFFGNRVYVNSKEAGLPTYEPVLTINAVDGSLVDRSLGY